MAYLIDTHIALWWLGASPELSEDLKELLRTEPAVHMSAVTPWEISLKHSLGKLAEVPGLPERVRDLQFKPLPITLEHGMHGHALPWLHRDPFDRMLVAQAQAEDLTIITRDAWIPKYDVQVLRA
ncbi:type II toxin-antitoxin system VapC family toxin [Streptomyces endophyticus]|uniref:Type II toxin-antitoxin system VapC family toxin n=1 Tax=Streptomyces endophyticus TaxID=714166 RepID=A0ABU6FAC5_9ACTN|nr:type II toxin-antitoxin system VapC family toxin [Streptomyces endophyticus]MEB8340986.1 type II toxin-antitoxin system VapC family toxin [Streptomyces endophyticus]